MLVIEPFYGGSHKVLIDNLTKRIRDVKLVTLPAKKWHWRARCSALVMLDSIPKITTERVLFCSSVLNLAELLGLRQDLHKLKKIVYFHENQLIYPVQELKARDIQYSYNQITTCLAADVILFNSNFNRNAFLDNIKKIIKMLPDFRPKALETRIGCKSQVLYFPVEFPLRIESDRSFDILHVVWPHRWEFDKGPDDFFQTLFKLKDNGIPFKLSVFGESFTHNPGIFETAKNKLKEEIINFGYTEDKGDYFRVMASAHVVVSTAKHEFFGVSVLEAVYCGCYPLAPNSLVYPELYPAECLYSDLDELYAMLKDFSLCPSLAMEARRKLNIDFYKYSSDAFVKDFAKLID